MKKILISLAALGIAEPALAQNAPYEWGDAIHMAERVKYDPRRAPMSVYEVHLGSWARDAAARYRGEDVGVALTLNADTDSAVDTMPRIAGDRLASPSRTSRKLAIQPGMRPMAKMTVNISSGMPMARMMMPL